MASHRAAGPAHLVPLASREAGVPPAGASAAERLRMLRELSEFAWRLSGRPIGPGARVAATCRIRQLAEPDAP